MNIKEAIIKANDISTTVTGSITGHPVRVLRNQLTKDYLALEKELTGSDDPDLSQLEELGAGALRRAVVDGDSKTGSLMAGQIAGLINERQSCEEIIQDYITGAQKSIEEVCKINN